VDAPCSAASMCHSAAVVETATKERRHPCKELPRLGSIWQRMYFRFTRSRRRDKLWCDGSCRTRPVGPYRASDAAALCEAVCEARQDRRVGCRGDPRSGDASDDAFVPAKTETRQACLVQLKTRELLARQRTQTIKALRSQSAEFGVIAPQGRKLSELIMIIRDTEDARRPTLARAALLHLVEQSESVSERIAASWMTYGLTAITRCPHMNSLARTRR